MNITPQEAKELFDNQLNDWSMARVNYEALAGVKSKDFEFDRFSIRVQFNPARIQSSAAKVDEKSISERKCFLCPAHLPTVQQGISIGEDYQLLVNPFPIFSQHFTIPTFSHTDQLILDRYTDMLTLAKGLNDSVVFYNGPKCGASAPDHAHFQAGNKGFLPIEKDIQTISRKIVEERDGLAVFAMEDNLRNFFLIEAKDKELATRFFKQLYLLLPINEGEKEPMLNILTWHADNRWYSCIFPRVKHRPSCYSSDMDGMLISPASVDLGGVFITPLEKDFEKVTAKDISSILQEVCISGEVLHELVLKLKQK